jgi:hypothetical protein
MYIPQGCHCGGIVLVVCIVVGLDCVLWLRQAVFEPLGYGCPGYFCLCSLRRFL